MYVHRRYFVIVIFDYNAISVASKKKIDGKLHIDNIYLHNMVFVF